MTENAIAGFWRRLGAFLVDGVVLGAVGIALGAAIGKYFPTPGGAGNLVGFVIAGTYFTLADARSHGGQSIGKRLLHLRLLDRHGRLLGPLQTFPRYCVVGIACFLNGARLPETPAHVWERVAGIPVFGIGLSILYLLVFNRRTRQSVHDLAVGSYTVNESVGAEFAPPDVWRGHYVVCACLLLASFVGAAFPPQAANARLTPLTAVRARVRAVPGVVEANVSDRTLWMNGRERTALAVTAFLDHGSVEDEALAARVARAVLETFPAAHSRGTVDVILSSGFDLGIARWSSKHSFSHTAEEWDRFSGG